MHAFRYPCWLYELYASPTPCIVSCFIFAVCLPTFIAYDQESLKFSGWPQKSMVAYDSLRGRAVAIGSLTGPQKIREN